MQPVPYKRMVVARNGLLERRIIELLSTTGLTFREIIITLKAENLTASIGIIRRINRDNRYRKPRYESKLTMAKRDALVKDLRDWPSARPNLSLLAKRYGVCHGSVWYWWNKLNRIDHAGVNLRKSSFKHKQDDLSLDPNYSAIGRVNLLTKKGQIALPVLMFVKKSLLECCDRNIQTGCQLASS